jgi:hypothetical protein
MMTGGGRTVADGGLVITGSMYKGLIDRTLENAGDAVLTAAGVSPRGDALLINRAGATFTMRGGGGVSADSTSRFENAGTLRVASAGVFGINASFTNTGTVELQEQSGPLDLDAGGSSSGAFLVGAGATLRFRGGTYRLGPTSRVTGAGNVAVSGPYGTVVEQEGAYAIGGDTNLSEGGGLVFLSDGSTGTLTLTLSGGWVTGAGTVTVTGLLTWRAGAMTGPGRTLANGGMLIDSSFAVLFLDGRTLDNAGTATWTGQNDLQAINGATVNNLAGATFDFLSTASLGSPAAAAAFNNAGTLRRTGPGNSTTVIGAAFTNTGTVEVQAGTLFFVGAFANFSGTTLTGGTYVVRDTVRFTGADVRTSAAALVLDGPGARVLDQSGGNALLNLSANAATGSLTLLNGRNLMVAGPFSNAGSVTVGAGCTFTISGGYTQTGGSTTLGGGATLASVTPLGRGLVDIDAGILSGSGTIDADVRNNGEIDPGGTGAAGVLVITGDYTQTDSGVLNIELGGTDAGAYDQLLIGGQATLDGTLNVTLLGTYFPTPGDTFQVLTFGSHVNDFATRNLPDLGADLYLDYQLGDTGLTLVTSSRS